MMRLDGVNAMNIRNLLYCLVVLLAACDMISVEDVEDKFRQEHPMATSITVDPTEGDADNIYFQINYSENGIEKSEVWLFQKNNADEWQLTHKQ